MDNTSGIRRCEAVRVHVSHHIMATLLLFRCGGCELVVLDIRVRLELLDRFVGDVETELFLGLCEVNPELSPCRESVTGREGLLHLRRAVAGVEGTA